MDWKLDVVVVPVPDVDRAKRFYGEQVGSAVDFDQQVGGGMRVVQLTPPGTGLVESVPGSRRGPQLVVTDVAAARAALVARGVTVSAVRHFEDGVRVDGPGGDWNAFVFFDDPDGNGWSVQQRPARA